MVVGFHMPMVPCNRTLFSWVKHRWRWAPGAAAGDWRLMIHLRGGMDQ
jgi:hypothetical protein